MHNDGGGRFNGALQFADRIYVHDIMTLVTMKLRFSANDQIGDQS
jgi:hypothetical protein